jgi:heme-degrading monooxygenase HmoA
MLARTIVVAGGQTADMGYVIVWRYHVAADAAEAFERAYGAGGPWARLFARHRGFRGTKLVRGDEAGVYLTIHRWASRAAFVAFMREAGDEYKHLDATVAAMTQAEELITHGAELITRGEAPDLDAGRST